MADGNTSDRVGTALTAARRLVLVGARREAAALCLSVADESGRLPEPRPDTPLDEYVRIARGHRLDGHRALALGILEAARRLTRVDASVLCEIGEAHATAGQIDRALAIYAEAIRLEPDFLEAHWEQGVLLERRGQIDEALDSWRRSDVSRSARRHSLYVAAALKSPHATNESLLVAQQDWARQHVTAARPSTSRPESRR